LVVRLKAKKDELVQQSIECERYKERIFWMNFQILAILRFYEKNSKLIQLKKSKEEAVTKESEKKMIELNERLVSIRKTKLKVHESFSDAVMKLNQVS
jgi:hypothetical protein